jgi:hypothetical protein
MIGQNKTRVIIISSTTLNKPIKKIAEAGKDFEEVCYTLLGSLAGRISEPSRWYGEGEYSPNHRKAKVIKGL